jgi:hypothetical protein
LLEASLGFLRADRERTELRLEEEHVLYEGVRP